MAGGGGWLAWQGAHGGACSPSGSVCGSWPPCERATRGICCSCDPLPQPLFPPCPVDCPAPGSPAFAGPLTCLDAHASAWPGAGSGQGTGALPRRGSAWLWPSQQMGSSHGLRIPLHEPRASSTAAHHKYSLRLRLSLRRAGRAHDPSRARACGCPGASAHACACTSAGTGSAGAGQSPWGAC